MCKEYNGWTNYPTWCVALWIDNDQGLYHMARETVNQATDYDIRKDLYLKDLVEELVYGVDGVPINGMTSDLMGWALSMVEWRDVVNHLLDS